MSTQIIKAEKFGIEEKTAIELTNGLSVPRAERDLLRKEFEEVSKLEVNKENKDVFRDLRLRIVKNRTQGTNKWHKAGKEYFLRGGQFLDAIKNRDNQENESMEKTLLDAENHFENLEKERIEKLQKERIDILSEYVEDANERDLAQMDEDVWESFLLVKKNNHQARLDAAKKIEDERIAKEKAEAKILEEQRLENIRLKEEKEAKEKEIEAERKKQADILSKQQEKADAEKKIQRKRSVEIQPLIGFTKDYIKLIYLPEKEYKKQLTILKKEADEYSKLEVKKKEKEAEIRLAKEKKVHEEQEVKLKTEREEKERIQVELQVKKDAEAKVIADKQLRVQNELSKRDSEKIKDLVADFTVLKTKYNFDSDKNKKLYSNVSNLIDKVICYIEK